MNTDTPIEYLEILRDPSNNVEAMCDRKVEDTQKVEANESNGE